MNQNPLLEDPAEADAAVRPMSPLQMVIEFHTAFRVGVKPLPVAQIDAPTEQLRLDLLDEEFQELKDAIKAKDLVEIADALADISYILNGTAAVYGIDLDAVIAEVHRSNMTKLGADGKPIYREDGKVLKGPDYEPPRISEVLAQQHRLVG